MRRLRVRGVLVSPDTVQFRQPLPLPDGSEVEVLAQEPTTRGSLPLVLATLERFTRGWRRRGIVPQRPKRYAPVLNNTPKKSSEKELPIVDCQTTRGTVLAARA